VLGQIHEERGRFAQAEAAFRQAVALGPGEPFPLTRFAHFLVRRGRHAEAVDLADRAAAVDPGDIDLVCLRGWIALRQGRTAEAQDLARWALSQDATDPEALNLLVAIKTRRSLLMGLWWRWAIWLGRLRPMHRWAFVIGLYVVWQVFRRTLLLAFPPVVQTAAVVAWLAFCIYTWVAPVVFDRMLKRELAKVRLNPAF
jgi:Flp pilus assembly protein TadD